MAEYDDDVIESSTLTVTEGMEMVTSRRVAKSIVNKHFRKAMLALENRGQTRRTLPGMLYAAMNILIGTLEPPDVIDVLTDRSRGICGSSDNADAPPVTISSDRMPAYIEAVTAAGQTIVEYVSEALEELEEKQLDDLFPETVLDVSLGVLLAAWGADHVRRALYEQSALLIRGVTQPVNFMEPSKLLDPDKKDKERLEANLEPTLVTQSPRVEEAKPRRPYQRVSGYLLSDMALSGANAWAIWLHLHCDDREDERLIAGVVQDHSGRAGWVRALRECVRAVSQDVQRVEGRIELSSEEMLRAIQGAPGSRLDHEADAWADVDEVCARHKLDFRYVTATLTHPAVEKCDFKIRELLQQS